MKVKFLKPNDPALRKISQEIPQDQINSLETKKIVETMLKVAYGKQKDKGKPVMVGLAVPQIGILKRIILVDVKANGTGEVGDLRIYINPQITWISKRAGEWYEGCFSTGRICGIVSRPTSIKIKAFTSNSLGVLSETPPRWDFWDFWKEAWRNWPKKHPLPLGTIS